MSSTLIRPGGRLRRTFAGVLASALVATPLALMPGSAHAVPDAPTLTWKISQQFVDHLSTRTLSDDVTFDADKGFTFTDGEGTFDFGNGTSNIAYKGSVKGAFLNPRGGAQCYAVTVADPIVSTNSAGVGTITAVVSSTQSSACGVADAAIEPSRVVVTTFDAASTDWVLADNTWTLTDTPNWSGVLPANSSTATDLGIPVDQPIDGKAFAASFLGNVTPGVRGHFYDTGTGSSNPKKVAAEFTATVSAATTTVAISASSPSTGLTVDVIGAGFTRSTNPGDAGLYVGIAPSGGLPDVSSIENLDNFAAAVPVWTEAINASTGAFATSLTADANALDPTKTYSVYTWRAHSRSTTSQDTETPLNIDFDTLAKYASAPVITAPSTSVYGKSAAVVVNVPTVNGVVATGNVVLTGAGTQTKALSGGRATFTLPANLSPGKRNLTASFQGDGNYTAASSAVRSFTVAKDSVTITDKVTKKPTTKKAGKITITVKAKSSSIKPTGKVKVYFKKKGQKTVTTSTGTLKNGVKALSVKKLKKKGTWKIYVKYTAGTGYSSVSSKYVGTVKVTK